MSLIFSAVGDLNGILQERANLFVCVSDKMFFQTHHLLVKCAAKVLHKGWTRRWEKQVAPVLSPSHQIKVLKLSQNAGASICDLTWHTRAYCAFHKPPEENKLGIPNACKGYLCLWAARGQYNNACDKSSYISSCSTTVTRHVCCLTGLWVLSLCNHVNHMFQIPIT